MDLRGRRLWHFVVKLLGGRVQWFGSDEGGLVQALEPAQLKVVGPIAYSNYVSGVIDGQKFFSGWNGDRGPLAMTRPVVCF